jgi:GTP-binding protein
VEIGPEAFRVRKTVLDGTTRARERSRAKARDNQA